MNIALIYFKKYWKYLVIILVAIFIIAYYVFLRKKNVSLTPIESSSALSDGLSEVKDSLTEVANNSTIQVAIAKGKHEEVKSELADIAAEDDKNIRRGRLAILANKVRQND